MLAEQGVNVNHSTIYSWVQRNTPEVEKRLRWYWRCLPVNLWSATMIRAYGLANRAMLFTPLPIRGFTMPKN